MPLLDPVDDDADGKPACHDNGDLSAKADAQHHEKREYIDYEHLESDDVGAHPCGIWLGLEREVEVGASAIAKAEEGDCQEEWQVEGQSDEHQDAEEDEECSLDSTHRSN